MKIPQPWIIELLHVYQRVESCLKFVTKEIITALIVTR